MSNVLGTLFGNIASAIREKNGESATMKPAEFPDKIRAIETGGGSPRELVWKSGTFEPTVTGAQTVNHTIGQVPDVLLVYAALGTPAYSGPITGEGLVWIGFSSAMHQALASNSMEGITPTWTQLGLTIPKDTTGIDTVDTYGNGRISECTDTTFKIGGTYVKLRPGSTYTYGAICGIV